MLLIAESIVSFLVQEIGSSIIEEINFLRGVRDQVFCLRIKLRYLKSVVLRDADDEERECNKIVRVHRDEIRKLVREIENVIDSYALIFSQGESVAKRCILRPCVLVRVHRIGVKIDRIQRRIQEAIGALNDFGSLGSVDDDDDKGEQRSSSCDMRSRL